MESESIEIKGLKARTCVLPQSVLQAHCGQIQTRFKPLISMLSETFAGQLI